jgi:hypothetical protein
MSQDGVSRRHFFYGSLLAGALPAAGYGSVPSLRALGYKPFYDKLNVAAIGCGGQGGDPGCSDFSISAPYAEWLALVAIALHVPGKLDWDSRNQRFTNSAEANKFVKPVFQKGWELKL